MRMRRDANAMLRKYECYANVAPCECATFHAMLHCAMLQFVVICYVAPHTFRQLVADTSFDDKARTPFRQT
jgi:hypothetical protein